MSNDLEISEVGEKKENRPAFKEQTWALVFVERALIEKIKIKTVFFFKKDLNESEQKSLNAACDRLGNVTDTGTLGYILRHHGWLVTNLLNDKQVKAQRLTNSLKKKVFSVSLNEVFILRETTNAN